MALAGTRRRYGLRGNPRRDAARQEAGGVSHEAAERAVQATLQTPNERLSRGGGEAVAHLAASLPQAFERS
jgi:uncharacterized protein (DUF2267 family)